jgi:hypothetical protein
MAQGGPNPSCPTSWLPPWEIPRHRPNTRNLYDPSQPPDARRRVPFRAARCFLIRTRSQSNRLFRGRLPAPQAAMRYRVKTSRPPNHPWPSRPSRGDRTRHLRVCCRPQSSPVSGTRALKAVHRQVRQRPLLSALQRHNPRFGVPISPDRPTASTCPPGSPSLASRHPSVLRRPRTLRHRSLQTGRGGKMPPVPVGMLHRLLMGRWRAIKQHGLPLSQACHRRPRQLLFPARPAIRRRSLCHRRRHRFPPWQPNPTLRSRQPRAQRQTTEAPFDQS